MPQVSSENVRPGFVYFFRCANLVKIGFSCDPERRARHIRTASSMGFEIVGLHPGTRADEGLLHEKFAARRHHGEWFDWCDEVAAVAANGFEPVATEPGDPTEEAIVVGAVVVPVFRKLFPRRPAAELRARTGYSERMCEYVLSQRREIGSRALAALLMSDIGEEVLAALRAAKSDFVR